MKRPLAGLFAGALFGVGLVVSEMVNPARVIGFLDITGAWDPTLAFVLGGALAIAIPGYWLTRRWQKPLIDDAFHVPPAGTIDAKLLVGAGLFGTGWGLAGLCPGPALAALGTGQPAILAYGAAMAGAMWMFGRWNRRS